MALQVTDISGLNPLTIKHYQDATTGKYYAIGPGGTNSAFRSSFTQKQIDNALATWKARGEVIPVLNGPGELLSAWSVSKTAARKAENAQVAADEAAYAQRQAQRASGQTSSPPDTQTNTQTGTGSSGAIDYTLHPGETIDQYNARIAAARGETQTAQQPQQQQGAIDYTLHQGETVDQYNARIASARSGTQTSGTQTPSVQTPMSGYTGPSIVDYLDSIGQASDFGTRATLAKQYGIQNYTGTAEQNTQLLNTLRSRNPQTPAPQNAAPIGTSAPATGNYISTQTPQPVDIQDVFKQYGVNLDLQGFMSNPVASFEDTYDRLYKNLGIADLKSEASRLLEQATKYDEELADKITEINDDPWLTEGVRVARIRKEQERYDLKKAGVTNTLALYDKTIDSLTDQARFLVQGAYNQYNADRSFTTDMIGFIYDRVDKANQAQIDLAKAQNPKPDTQIVTAGGRTLLIDKNTGATISDLGFSGSKDVSGGTGGGTGGGSNAPTFDQFVQAANAAQGAQFGLPTSGISWFTTEEMKQLQDLYNQTYGSGSKSSPVEFNSL